MEQKGTIFRAGGWWWLKYRDSVIDTDPQSPTYNQIIRKQLAKKLEPVLKEHQRLKRAPEQVEKTARAFLAPINNNQVTPESTMTVGQFVEKMYLPYAEQQHHASTKPSDVTRWEKHLKPRCENVRLRDFRTVTGSQIIADIARQNDLASETLKRLKSFLSAVFKYAKNQGFFDGENPIRDVIIPKARKKKPTRAYTLDQINDMLALLDAAGELRSATIVAVAGFAGLTRSEIQGLRWQDYRTSAEGEAELHVERSVWEGIVDETKTLARRAPVPVISALAARLDRYRESLSVRREVKPEESKVNPEEPIFAARNGEPLRLNNLLRTSILPVLNRCIVCGKPQGDEHKNHAFKRDESRPAWYGWHAFRRGLATNLSILNVHEKVAQGILRHAQLATTQEIYNQHQKVAPELRAGINRLQRSLVKKREKVPAKRGKQLVN